MDAHDFQRLATLFEAGRELEFLEQERLIDEECGDRPALRERLAQMFASERECSPDELEAAMHRKILTLHDPVAEAPPERIGRFRIRRTLGSGGMGTVFEAEEDEPRRLVALKVLRADVFTPEHGQRLEAEAAHLARLSHPGIARIYSAGRTQLGGREVPWIATELLPGGTLLEHADRAELGDADRVRLLLEVLDAVTHAHQRGIIHRDLKPDNILVDEHGHPRVLDFGIARLQEEDTTSLTRTGQLLGSLESMSPEQAAGRTDAVDTRTDVHALGTIGYRLLTGIAPHDLSDLSLPQALRSIAEASPPALSTADPRFRGDLSLIFAKAMALEPDARYPTVDAFAADLRRYLAGEPVRARPPSSLYRLRLLVRRHPVATSLYALATVGLLAFAAVTAHFASVEQKLRERSDRVAMAARTQAAGIALADGNLDVAVQLLENIDERHAGWELEWLRASIEDSVAGVDVEVIEASPAVLSGGRALLRTRDGIFACDLRTLELQRLADAHRGERLVALSGGSSPALLTMDDGALAVFDPEAGRPRHPPIPMEGGVKGARGIPGSEDVLVIGNGSVRRVAPDMGAVVWETAEGVPGIHVSPCGRFAVVPFQDRVRMFDLDNGNLRTCALPAPPTTCVAWHADGTELAVARSDGRVHFLDPSTLQIQGTLAAGESPVVRMALRRDGLLATAHADGRLRVRARNEASPRASWVSVAHVRNWRHPVTQVWFDAEDGVVTASRGGLRRFDLEEPGRPRVIEDHQVRDRRIRWVNALALGPGDGQFLTGGGDGVLALRDSTGRMIRSLEGLEPIRRITIRRDTHVAAATTHKGLVLIDLEANRVLRRWGTKAGHGRPAFTPDGQTIWLPRQAGRQPLAVHHPFDGVLEPAPAAPGLSAVVFLGDGGRIEGFESGLCLLHAPDGTSTPLTPRDGKRVASITPSPAGDRVVTCRAGGDVRLWNLGTLELLVTYEGHGGVPVHDAAFSPDGRRVASCDRRGRIQLWETEGGQTVLTLDEHEDYVFDVAFTRDGKSLLSVSGDGTVRVWSTNRR